MFIALLVHLAFVTMPACPTEDSSNCVWDASVRGNGTGQSFVNVGGQVWGVITS